MQKVLIAILVVIFLNHLAFCSEYGTLERELLILPGVGIEVVGIDKFRGRIDFGDDLGRIYGILGQPDGKMESIDAQCLILYDDHGLVLFLTDGKLSGVAVTKFGFMTQEKTISVKMVYKTKEGISVGSSKSEVIKNYGANYSLQDAPPYLASYCLYYDSIGIGFMFKNELVRAIIIRR